MYLLDTEVLLELRNAKSGRTDPGLASWASNVSRQNLFISALTLIELENAATRFDRKDRAGGAALREWIYTQVLRAFEGRVLAIDAAVARNRAQLSLADARDALLAATAAEHGLTLVTRHARAFKGSRIKLFNPWGYTPDALDDDADWRQAGRTGPLWLKNLFVRA